jgi:hypothetical protein
MAPGDSAPLHAGRAYSGYAGSGTLATARVADGGDWCRACRYSRRSRPSRYSSRSGIRGAWRCAHETLGARLGWCRGAAPSRGGWSWCRGRPTHRAALAVFSIQRDVQAVRALACPDLAADGVSGQARVANKALHWRQQRTARPRFVSGRGHAGCDSGPWAPRHGVDAVADAPAVGIGLSLHLITSDSAVILPPAQDSEDACDNRICGAEETRGTGSRRRAPRQRPPSRGLWPGGHRDPAG